MNSLNELKEIEQDIKKSKNSIDKHLLKFDDIDLFFKSIEKELKNLFENQNDFDDIQSFKSDLKEKLKFYVSSFQLSRKERKTIREKLSLIEQQYSDIIYYNEFNPIKSREEGESGKVRNDIVWKMDEIL